MGQHWPALEDRADVRDEMLTGCIELPERGEETRSERISGLSHYIAISMGYDHYSLPPLMIGRLRWDPKMVEVIESDLGMTFDTRRPPIRPARVELGAKVKNQE